MEKHMSGGFYPGPAPDRQFTPITRGQALAIVATCGAILALAILGAVI
jgi:hypothetical protein